jgi:methylphosphotriester-DNA--protein-cysteine methyltransferase
MKFEQHLPSLNVKPFLKDILFIETEAATRNLILPDTSLVLAIRYKGSVSAIDNGTPSQLPLAVLSGLRISPRHIAYSAAAANLLVRFEPGGAAAFFTEPLQEFFQESVPAADLKGYANMQTIATQLAEMSTNTQRANFIQQFLLTKLKTSAPDPLLRSAIQSIRMAKGALPIKGLAKQLYISQDAFEKRFRRSVGMTAKHFASLVRLRHIVDTYSPEKSHTLTHLAHSAGYFDQAHFIHDFQRFTGQPPRQFFATANYW